MNLGNMIMEAYVLANPSKSRADIILERIAVDNEWESSVGLIFKIVLHCKL